MNVESYSFVLIAALLGMGIVFFFLIVLSVLMRVIRYFFDDEKREARLTRDAVSGTTDDRTVAGANVVDSHGIPRWVVAGSLAYLVAEEREYAPHARGWTERGLR